MTQNSPRTLAANLIRLEKHIAQEGLASRREAKDLISRGFVKVNGSPVKNPGFGIDPKKDKITIKKDSANKKEYVLLYKPRGIETNKTTFDLQGIHEKFPSLKHLAPIGRLDAESDGLILLSNDGTLAKALTKADSKVSKTYLVKILQPVTEGVLEKMSRGIMLDGVRTKPAQTEKVGHNEFTIVLHEGRKHQIRLMSQHFKWHVTSLTRIKIGHLSTGKMKPGEFVHISEADVKKLKTN